MNQQPEFPLGRPSQMNLSNTKMIIAGLLGALCFASAASASATTLKDRAWYTQEGAAKPVLFSIMPPDKAQEGDHAFRACQYYAEDTHQKWHSCGYFREPGVPKASDEMPQPQDALQFHASDSAPAQANADPCAGLHGEFLIAQDQHMVCTLYANTNDCFNGFCRWTNPNEEYLNAPFHPVPFGYGRGYRHNCCYAPHVDYRPATKTEKAVVGTIVTGVGVAVLVDAFSGHGGHH